MGVKMQRIYQSFERQTMMQTLGAQLGEVRAGYVEIIAPILPGSLQQHGYAHAALIFAIGDSAAGYAALSVMGEEFEVLTAEMKINLLAPGRDGPLRAVGNVEKSGRRLIIVRADVFDGEVKVALMQGTMVPVKA
ncbi:PaaI family thioesterase [Planktomarina sp.]|jgi:uncharacterized protein (TIGR00369 family)|nr:PaaI family thioesterase [Planktomarina sp.]|tara:strand:+ start:541 stop:945 length:405 start_codon:yes stop_codon:yes gene_type:complete